MKKKITEILKANWGYDSFRELQEAIILSVMEGKDTLALMPTGGGKSICFQVPVLAQEGIGIVVSPLIALMKDQVENLKKRGINAIGIYSGMSKREIDIALDNCIYGKVKFLYVSPERLSTEIFKVRFQKMNVNLIAIDEAHCISQWGHDFRPAYRNIMELKELTDVKIPFLAVTATANDLVAKDIVENLGFESKGIFKQSFERKNLGYLVLPEENKKGRLLKIIASAKNSCGIVYVNTRKRTFEISNFLNKNGISADFYHGGLPQKIRSEKQENWINDKTQIIVATNAFGMGIDKPNVRIVVHMDLPSTPEAYFQEAGRGGRDGKKSFAVLLYKSTDKLGLEKLHELEFPELKTIKTIYNCLGNFFQLAIGAGKNNSYDFDIGKFSTQYNQKPLVVYNALKLLERNEYLSFSEAIFRPARINVKVNHSDLYSFQVSNKRYDSLIQILLRSHEGIFDSFCKLDVPSLARRLKKKVTEIEQMLFKLDELNIVSYKQASDAPLLIYVQDRMVESRLKITKETYLDRKKIKRKQLDFMIRYCEDKHICRSRLLLSYFDETDFKDCEICDVCIEKNKKDLSSKKHEEISRVIIELLLAKDYSVRDLVNSIMGYEEKEVISVVQWLLDNEKIQNSKFHKLSMNLL